MSDLNEFLRCYTVQNENSRFFTKSQIFIAYRAFLSRIRPSTIVTMDYGIFSVEFEEEAEKLKLNIKSVGKISYYELFLKPCNKKNSESKKKINFSETPNDCVVDEKNSVKILLKDLNIYLCCKLCCGYLVDATTITECLHSFCKSCIVKHFYQNKSCPACGTVVHNTNPYTSLKPDIVLQDIVNKLLPGIITREQRRFNDFQENKDKSALSTSQPYNSVMIYVEWVGKSSCTIETEDLIHKFIRVSDQTTIAHVAQFVLQKLGKLDKDSNPLFNCKILCGGVTLPYIFTIEDIVKEGLNFLTKKGLPLFHYDLEPLK